MKIVKMKIKNNFKYLWLKTVEDVDLSVHCARCLIGKYDERISNKKTIYNNIELDRNKIYYLCGVTEPFNWNNNFHIAFRYKEGSVINIEENKVELYIENAERIEINEKYIKDFTKGKQFTTCRNWQFANYYNEVIKNDSSSN